MKRKSKTIKESKWIEDLFKDAKWIDSHLANLEKVVMRLCKLMVKLEKKRCKE
jgi:hypothetical protein